MKRLQSRQEPGYQKWIIICLSALMVCVALGFCSSPRSFYVAPVTQALGFSRSAFSITDSCRFVATAVVNLFFGSLIARFGPKKLIAAGFVCLIAAMLLCASAEELYLFYLAGLLLGVGLSWTTTTMVGYVVNLWCRERKGTIMGAVLATNGIGGAVAMQVISPVIERPDDLFAYRDAYRLTALILLVVGAVVLIFFRDKPQADAAAQQGKKPTASDGAGYGSVLRQPVFYAAVACIFLTGLVLQGVQGVTAAHLKDAGLDAGFVAKAMSCQSLALAVFKFLTGWIYDKKGLRVTSGLCMLTAVVCIFLLARVSDSTAGRLCALIFCVFSALALPLETVMLPIYAQALFDQRVYSRVLGVFVSVNSAGYASGGVLTNLCYDLTGDYRAAFYAGCALMLIVLLVMQRTISAAGRQKELSK